MTRPMRYLSVCSGIEAASVAWHPLGWAPIAFSEIDPFASAVLAHRFPSVPNLGDMTRHESWPIEPGSVDVLVGGTPCQSFSLAGLRKGLADPRGNLALVWLSIIDRLKPRYTVWENVPGVLSSNGGRDFGTLLGGMAELGYGFAYRVLDAQFVRVESHARAVPQRRRRVFVVGCAGGDWERAAEVLSLRESVRGNPPARRETREGASRGHFRGADKGFYPAEVSERTRDGHKSLEVNATGAANALVTPNGGRGGLFTTTIIDVTNITRGTDRSNPQPGDPCHTLTRGAAPPVAIIDTYNQSVSRDGVSHTLLSRGDTPGGNSHLVPAVACPVTANEQRTYTHEGYAFKLRNVVGDVPPHAYDQTIDEFAHEKLGDAVPATAFKPAHFTRGKSGSPQDVAPSCLANADRGDQDTLVNDGLVIRRLTPRECERLQGFPDDWTLIPHGRSARQKIPAHAVKPAADAKRYKAIGNSMAVNVMRWIGDRIAEVDKQ